MNIHVTNYNEFHHAMKAAGCGDIICMAPGTYITDDFTGRLRRRFRLNLLFARIHRWILSNSLEP